MGTNARGIVLVIFVVLQVILFNKRQKGVSNKMEVKILQDDSNRLDVMLKGEDLGLAKLVVEKLLESKSVTFAAADVEHPLIGNPIIRVQAKDPKKELEKAVDAVEKDFEKLEKQLQKI